MSEDLQGRVIDRKYRLVRLIGEGGMGTVWEAEHTMLSRKMAVKVMHAGEGDTGSGSMSAGTTSMERFFREAQAASAIGHPNIIEIYDVGTEPDGTTFIVMELLKGVSLEDVLEAEGSLSPRRTVAIILQVLSALFSAHKKGIIHRDLKPDNVYLAVDQRMREEVKLLDFGVAKILEGGEEQLGLTKTGSVLGTPYYLAPEQARGGKDIDERIDIWSVGVMMYEMLTGQLPFDGDNYNEVLGKILMDDIPPIKEYAPRVPDGLAAVVEKALYKDRDQRYRDVAAMLDDLVQFHDSASDQIPTGAIEILKRSVDRPPPVDERFRVELPDERPERPLPMPPRPKRRRPRDPDAATTLDSVLLKTIDEPPAEPPDTTNHRKRVIGLVAAGGAVLAAFVVVMAIVLGGTGGDSAADQGQPVAEPGSGSTASDTGAPAGSKVDAGAPVAVGAEVKADAAVEAGPTTAAAPAEVTISIKGLPPGARATFDGKPVITPFTVARSARPGVLKVTAPGHFPFKAKVERDKDRTFTVKMHKRGGKPGKGDKKPSGWKPNPFD